MLRAWEIAEQRAPEGMEYLHTITYWMVIGDHFYQIQTQALQAKAMEEYFTWMLRDKARMIDEGHYVELQAEFDRDLIEGDLGEVRSIEIGGLVPETVRADPFIDLAVVAPDVDVHKLIGHRVAEGFQMARQILTDLMGHVQAQAIIEAMPPEAALEVKVNIGYRAKKRKFSKEFMNNLTSGLRNIPDGEIKVRGKNGEIRGDDARLSYEMSVKRHSETNSLLDLEDVLLQMREVHRRFLHDGKIAP